MGCIKGDTRSLDYSSSVFSSKLEAETVILVVLGFIDASVRPSTLNPNPLNPKP